MEAQYVLPEHTVELEALMGKYQRIDPLPDHPDISLRFLPGLTVPQ